MMTTLVLLRRTVSDGGRRDGGGGGGESRILMIPMPVEIPWAGQCPVVVQGGGTLQWKGMWDRRQF